MSGRESDDEERVRSLARLLNVGRAVDYEIAELIGRPAHTAPK